MRKVEVTDSDATPVRGLSLPTARESHDGGSEGGRRRPCAAFLYPLALFKDEKDDGEEGPQRSRPVPPPQSHFGPVRVQSEASRSGPSMFGRS